MSALLNSNKEFVHLLLNSSKDQAVALLFTATKAQLDLITEIIFNLLQLPLPPKATRLVKKNIKTLQALSRKQTARSTKQRLLKNHYRDILPLLWAVKSQLASLQ